MANPARERLRKAVSIAILSLTLLSTAVSIGAPMAGAYAPVDAYCRDTVATYSAQCFATGLEPYEEVTFKVIKPDRTAVRFDAKADRNGRASADLSRYHTVTPGSYRVAAYLSWLKEPSDLSYDSFSVIDERGSRAPSVLSASAAKAVGGPIATFKITAPPSVKAGEAFDVTVCAVDEADQPVDDYKGTILFFAAGDPNAVLPFQNDGYTFTGTDPDACHTFAKGATLTKAGQVKLAVADVDSPDIAADTAITVTDTNANTNASASPGPGTGTAVAITSPTNNSTYGETSVPILGTGPKSSKITIMDGDRELGSVQSDADGSFSYTARNLTDGKHDFSAEAFDAGNVSLGTSATVSVTVNTQGATVRSLTILPGNTVAPATPLTVTVVSDPDLSRVRLTLDGVAHDLREDASVAGKYETTFAAPAKTGTYDIRLQLTNALNKETSPTVTQTVTVREVEEKLTIAANVGERPGTATVTWQAPQDPARIKQYRIFYGTSPSEPEFDVVVENKGTTAMVEGLKGDTVYYFSIAPVYDDGREGVLSDTVSIRTPTTTIPLIANPKAVGATRRINLSWDEPDLPASGGSFNAPGALAQYVIDYSSNADKPEAQVKTGSTATSWYIPNLEECKEYFFQITAVDRDGKPLARSPVFNGKTSCEDNTCQEVRVSNLRSIVEADGSQTLLWNPVLGARAYRVYAGRFEGDASYGRWDVTDPRFPIFANRFPAGAEIVFAVQALGEGNCFENAAVSNVLRTRVGPGLWMALFLTASAGAYAVIRRRKLIAS